VTRAIGDAIREASETVRAPHGLRERIAPPPRRRRRPAIAAALAGMAAVMAVLLIGGGTPTVPEVAAAALDVPERAPTRAERERFTRWGWEAVGARTDEVAGRRAHTVIYRSGGRGVHYTIVEGSALRPPEGGRRRGGYAISRAEGATVVSWRRADGHTCVVASRAVGVEGLLEFAGWE
jgi:hypothetical protein